MELKKGYKQSDLGVIPMDWEVKKLGELGDVKMCRRIFNYETKPSGEIPFFKIGTFGKEPDAFISEELFLKYKKRFSYPEKGEILISAAGTIGRTVVYNGEPSYFQDSNIIWINNSETIVSNQFLYHVLQDIKYTTEGGTIQRLYNSILKNTQFICPTYKEQTAIAKALSDSDAYINSLEKLIKKKRLIKQGAIQELLTPKDGWEEKRFNEICDLIHGHQFLSSDFVEASDGIKVVKIGNVQSGKFNTGECDRVSKEKLHLYKKYILKNGDILMSLTGNIGRVVIVENIKETLLQNYRVGKFEAKDIDNRFLAYCLASPSTTKQLESNSNQTSQANFGKQDFIKIKISIPKDRRTQEFIANTLYDLDSEVNLLEKKLIKVKMLKHGIMQNLLTGKIRLQ